MLHLGYITKINGFEIPDCTPVLVLAAAQDFGALPEARDAGEPVRRDRRFPAVLGTVQRERDGNLGE